MVEVVREGGVGVAIGCGGAPPSYGHTERGGWG